MFHKLFWKSWILFLTPFLCAVIFLNNRDVPAMKCGYILLIMATYWVTEALPVAVTALLPVAAVPLLGIMSTSAITLHYMKATNFLFIGGLIMAIAVENTGLHRRVALKLLLILGTKPRLVMLAFMVATSFLSMWISNTAATSMMIPIVDAVASFLESGTKKEKDQNIHEEHWSRRKMLLLSIAYAANIGGTGVITGSPPNFVLPAKLNEVFGSSNPLSFFNWMVFCAPLMIINLVMAFGWLSTWEWYERKKMNKNKVTLENVNSSHANAEQTDYESKEATNHGPVDLEDVIEEAYKSLGNWTQGEKVVSALFLSLIFFWFFRDPKAFPGWAVFFPHEKVEIGDATMTVLVVILTFSLPMNFKFWPFQGWSVPIENSPSILEWEGTKGVEKRLQWGVVFLLGGGFAISEACQISGLSSWIGERLSMMLYSPFISSIIIIFLTTFITEFASNTATANVLIPILMGTSKNLCMNPIYLGMGASLSCSYAFMLPAATAPNAIIKGVSGISTDEMMKIGFVMNIICITTTVLYLNGFGRLLFDFDGELPIWVMQNKDFALCAHNQTILAD